MKTLLLCVMAMPLAALAASNSPDASFYKKAAEAGISEVDLGNLAEQKSPDQQVKDFGAMMVKDHSAANEKLQALAASKGISLPSKASVAQMATKAKLDVLSGETFDKSYIKSQVTAHTETIALLNKEISSGQDPDAKAFAQSVLPTVRSHLKAIRSIAAGAKAASASQ
jgi:putative membrane protein